MAETQSKRSHDMAVVWKDFPSTLKKEYSLQPDPMDDSLGWFKNYMKKSKKSSTKDKSETEKDVLDDSLEELEESDASDTSPQGQESPVKASDKELLVEEE